MKKTKIIYWVFTILAVILMGFSAIPDALCLPDAISFMTKLGYPVYIIRFLGIAKLLGVTAIVIPGRYRVKEWAYAGLLIDLVGANYSVIAVGTPLSSWAPLIIWYVPVIGSYVYYRKLYPDSQSQQ